MHIWIELSLVVLLLSPVPVFGVPKSDLFPFGFLHGDSQLPTELDDGSSSELQLKTQIVFYDTSYNSIFINANGLLSFLTEIPNFFNVQFPLDYPVIAPFYSDVDTRGTGTVYYRETQQKNILDRVNGDIHRHFLTGASFSARSALIVTWEEVGYYNSKTDHTNTFQVVIATDGYNSYAIVLYTDIQWISSEGKSSNVPDARAQAGFMSGDGRTHLLLGSGTDQIRNIHRISNVGDRGQWMFHIGNTGASGNILEPDINLGEAAISFQAPQSCAIGAAFCHQHARCIDYYPGFCCECGSGFFGNGRNCLQDAVPLRLNGKVTGNLNGEAIEDSDLHSYVVTSEGRAYTAISRIPGTLGFDIQSLLPIGGIVGWLFATPRGKAKNGYQITGGVFNHTLEVEFPQTGQRVRVRQNFQGLDVFGYLRVSTDIQGNVPTIPYDTKIEMDDYDEEYTHSSKGMIRSHASRGYSLEGNEIVTSFTLDQTIMFEECTYAPVDPELQTLRLKVARNYIVYDPREEVIRYAVTNKITPLTTEDPCQEGSQECGPHSSCVVEGDSWRCVCNPGYEYLYSSDDRAICVDTNECTSGRDQCHSYAECINQPGSYACRCLPGYTGNGIECHRHLSCSEMQCDENAECHQFPGSPAECRCRPGFQGNGLICIPYQSVVQDCQEDDVCDPNANCVYNPAAQQHQCQCLPGYTGDGVICIEELETCDVINNCHPTYASCVFDQTLQGYYCVCNVGYKGNGYYCEPSDQEISCNVLNTCHPHAQCIYDTRQNGYLCRCNAGYDGDGYTCNPADVTCDKVNICSIYADCVYDPYQSIHVCRCHEDYSGDGISCTPTDECNSDDKCHHYAKCVFDNVARRHRCRCNPGYLGNGKECTVSPDASCNIADNCHPNAKCLYDSVNLRYRCQCNAGYHGDGVICAAAVVSCNILNNCHPNANCDYDNNERGYRCQCHNGFAGDGLTCIPARSCQSDPSQCHPNAECVVHPTIRQHTCQCSHGYQGDGFTCHLIPTHEGNFLLVNQGMATLKVPLSATAKELARPLVLVPHQTAVGIDIDCVDGQFYWTDLAGGIIMRANYDGTAKEPVIDRNIVSPESVAVDWVSRNIFWTDSGRDKIEVAKINSQDRKVIVNSELVNPRGITLHPGRGKIYWTDWDRRLPKIESADMDGTNREIFVSESLGLPNSLTVDYEREDLCWADAGTQKIECISLNGHNRRTVIAPVAYPFGLANNRETLYWTDWETKQIHSASKIGYHLNAPKSSPLGGNSKLYGIVVVPDRCPRVSNPCAVNNGGCQYLCLPNGRGGRTCLCSDYGTEEEVEACNEIS